MCGMEIGERKMKIPTPVYSFTMADAVIETPKEVCVFEFKYAKSAKAAIRQIRERGYADKWAEARAPSRSWESTSTRRNATSICRSSKYCNPQTINNPVGKIFRLRQGCSLQ